MPIHQFAERGLVSFAGKAEQELSVVIHVCSPM
jgi:hypothetical protein